MRNADNEKGKPMKTFTQFAANVARNASTYKSKVACALMVARVKARWLKAGGYGNQIDARKEAVAALQDRWMELHAQEIDARNAAILA